MRLFGVVDGQIDPRDRAGWLTIPFDRNLRVDMRGADCPIVGVFGLQRALASRAGNAGWVGAVAAIGAGYGARAVRGPSAGHDGTYPAHAPRTGYMAVDAGSSA